MVALDVETTGLNPFRGAKIFCWGYCTNKGERGMVRASPAAFAWVRRLFADPTKHVVFHNAKFDLKMFHLAGVDVFEARCKFHCTLILSKLYNMKGVRWSHDLIDLAYGLLGRKTDDKTAITDWLKHHRRAFEAEHGRSPGFHDAPWDLVQRRCLWDVESTLGLFKFLFPAVYKASPSLYNTERELMLVVVDMEVTGVLVDITRARQLRDEALTHAAHLQRLLDRLVCPLVVERKKRGLPVEVLVDTFNANSTASHLPAAFNKLGIPLLYKTKPKKGKKGKKGSAGGRWCFDEYAMIRYMHPALAAITRASSEEGWKFDRWFQAIRAAFATHRIPRSNWLIVLVMKQTELRKMCSTYYNHIIEDAVDQHQEPNGRMVGTLHCNFNQIEAMSGRFSSSKINLQNLPRILGPRECFIPRRSRRNWHNDYEQVEMKWFVHFARDPFMASVIDQDIHLAVAAEIYHTPREAITKEQRKRAKGVNFGILYGAGGPKMAETLTRKGLHTSSSEGQTLVANYHRRFPSVHRLTNALKVELNQRGFVTNPFDRRYHISPRESYTCINYMCQGSSADLIKQRMVRLWKALRAQNLRSKILMQVHDELVVEIPPAEEPVVVPLIKQVLEARTEYFVPMTIDQEVVTHRWSQKRNPKDVPRCFN